MSTSRRAGSRATRTRMPQADYSVEVNASRWAAAQSVECTVGVAVCDSDPLTLHYSCCLARIGAGSVERWESELRAVRRAFDARRLGFADLVLVSVPELETLRMRKAGDPTRRRRSFERHVRLREPLRGGIGRWSGSGRAGLSGSCPERVCRRDRASP